MQQARLFGHTKFSESVLTLMVKRIRLFDDIVGVRVYSTSDRDRESAIFLLITPTLEVCQNFIELVGVTTRDEKYKSLTSSELRFVTFCQCWSEFADWVKTKSDQKLKPAPHVDILVVTPDWANRIPYFELSYHSDVPMFLYRLIGKDPLIVA